MTDDKDLWLTIIEDVEPLTRDAKNRHVSHEPDAKIFDPEIVDQIVPEEAASKPDLEKTSSTEKRTETDYQLSEIDLKTFKKIKRGAMTIDYRLDLHHMTRHEAKLSLINHVQLARRQGGRCFLAITGRGDASKGTGVIRKELPLWLETAPLNQYVYAYKQAARHDGGDGAFYLLLRRPSQ